MKTRVYFLALIGIALLIVTGCNRSVENFRLEVYAAADITRSHRLSEDPPQRPEDEGYLLADSGATPRYSLKSPVAVPAEGEEWVFTLSALDRPMTIELTGPAGEPVGQRSFAPVAVSKPGDGEMAVRHRLVIRVPGGVEVSGFHIAGDVPAEAERTRPRLLAVEVFPGTNPWHVGISETNDAIVLGTGVAEAVWESRDGAGFSWSVITDQATWDPLAPLEVGYDYSPDTQLDPGPGGAQTPTVDRARLQVGSASLEFAARPGTHRIVVYPTLYAALATDVTIRSALSGFRVTRIGPAEVAGGVADETPRPLPADLGTVHDYLPDMWRDSRFELFRWTLFPDVLVMDTASYLVQSRFFKRLAFFTEKEGYRGRILTDSEMAGRHGYNAHNYSAAGLADFFSAADQAGVELNSEELLLRRIALAEGLITRSAGGFAPGTGGILSVSQESTPVPGLRRLLLTHEAYHGVHYGSQEYAHEVARLWDSLPEGEQRYWILLLDGMQYDVTDPFLVQNEFHAYLLQQPVEYANWYFEQRSASRLRQWKPGEADWLDRFLRANPGVFRMRAVEVNQLLFKYSGLVGGDVFCLGRFSQ